MASIEPSEDQPDKYLFIRPGVCFLDEPARILRLSFSCLNSLA